MNVRTESDAKLDLVLAGLLRYGTWAASAVMGVGLVLTLIASTSAYGLHVMAAGCACFILLPPLGVLTMLIAYVRERDYVFVAITAVVLLIIVGGLGLGIHMAKAR